MTQTTEFELAQTHLKDYQRTRTLLMLWSALFAGTLITHLIFGGTLGCWLPFHAITGVMALTKALRLYYKSPEQLPQIERVEQEMGWLFSDDWRDLTGAHEYGFAQDRIQRRRIDRWEFLIHVILFLLASALLIFGGMTFLNYGESVGRYLVLIPVVWFVLALLPHCLRAFPTRGMLIRRERRTGDALRRELRRMQPEKLKNEDKSKREVQYTLGDDGELVEASDPAQPKLKRDEF
ncbi:MAG: hypothetical protein ABI835_02660 [Chloroflexota bacterium]